MAKQSSYQAFPLHANTYQGVASGLIFDESMFPNYLLKTLEDTDITIDYAGGQLVLTGIGAGNDFVLPGNIGTITTTGKVLIS